MKRALVAVGILLVVVIAVAGTVFALGRTGDGETHEDQADEPTGAPSPTATELPSAPAPPPAPSPDEEPAELDMDAETRDALESVALEAAAIMTTWDPGEDFNQTEAELRAADLMTEERAAEIVAPQRPATGEEWLEAAEAGATSTPSVEVNEATESDVVSVIATWTWIDSDAHVVSNPRDRRVFYFDFAEVDGELLISDYQWESL